MPSERPSVTVTVQPSWRKISLAKGRPVRTPGDLASRFASPVLFPTVNPPTSNEGMSSSSHVVTSDVQLCGSTFEKSMRVEGIGGGKPTSEC